MAKKDRITVERNIQYDKTRQKYYVKFDYGFDENGKRLRPQKTFDTLKEARIALKQFAADKEIGKIVKPKRDTLSEYLDYWLNTVQKRTCRESTLYGYSNIVNKHLKPNLGHLKLQELNVQDVNKYLLHLKEKNLSDNTIKKHYALLNSVLNNAYREKKVIENIMLFVNPVNFRAKEIEIYSVEELNVLLEKVSGHALELPVFLGGLLGLRRSEINGLTWDNINFNDSTITINKGRVQVGKQVITTYTKNKTSERTIAADKTLMQILIKEREKQEENERLFGDAWGVAKNKDNTNDLGYVFCKTDGTLYRPNFISNYFPKFLERNNLRVINFHALRHCFASITIQLTDASLFETAKILGHSNTNTTTKTYGHLLDKTNKEVISQVANVIMGTKQKE